MAASHPFAHQAFGIIFDVSLSTQAGGATNPPPQTWFQYWTTEPQIIGIVGWIGTLIGVISLVVTIAGFALAITQIRRVKRSAEAAQEAVTEMTNIVRAREQNARLSHTLSQLRCAGMLLQRNNPQGAGAYLDAGCTALVEARQLSTDQEDKERMTTHIIQLRKIVEVIGPTSVAVSPNKLKAFNADIRSAVGDLEEIAAKLHYTFDS